MTHQRAVLSMIGFVLVVTLVGIAVRYAKTLSVPTEAAKSTALLTQ
jgi:hypothetical protein